MKPPTFASVFESECGYVLHSLRRMGIHEQDLEDLAQDVFIAVHRCFGEYDPARPLRPWLFAFAYRAAANYRRLARHRRESVFEPAAPERGAPPTQENVLVEEERRRALHRALATLDLKHRAVLILVELDGVSPQVVAETLEIPLDTVYSRMRNGRKKLRESLIGADADETSGANHA